MKRLLVLLMVLVFTLGIVPTVSAADAVSAKAISSGYEISSFIKEDKVYFFMPTDCDITNVSVATFSESGKELSRQKGIDFSKENNVSVEIGGKKYPVVLMKSELPSLVFNLNEEYGKIEDMNTSPDHSVNCYGDVSLIVSERDAKEKGWKNFTSQENKEESPGTISIKGRGNSTWTWKDPASKKPYQFKLEKGEGLLGMGKHKTWVIIKNDADVIKNKLGLDLAKRIGLDYASDSEFVDVFMNGEYLGVYLLSEKVELDEERINISDLESEYEDNNNSTEGLDLTGGYLVEIDNWGDGDIRWMYRFPNGTHTWYVVKTPETLADKATTDNAYSYIINKMNSLFDSVYKGEKFPDGSSYLDNIDVDSFIRYFYHQEFLKNYDSGISSTYFFKDKDSKDTLLHAGPVWDHDRIFESGGATGWALQTICTPGTTTPTFYNQLGRRLDFATLLVDAYENTDISDVLKNSYELVDIYAKDIGVSAEMNAIRWNLKEFNPDRIKQLMINRAEWIDNNYKSLLTVARDDGITVLLDNMPIIFDVKPMIRDSRTLVPVRAIFEALGAEVDWQAETRTVIAKKGDTTVEITIDKAEMYVNGQAKALDVSASITDGRTLIPLRAVSEAFYCNVDWDGDTQTVFIVSQN